MKKEKRLTTEECKNISLKILIDIDKFCRENNITYFLACGTLLGAVRHQGFIPWDDDVDIMMPRPDYNKFIKSYSNKNYKVSGPYDGLLNYSKVYDVNTVKYELGVDYKKCNPIGVDVDVFPLDGIVNNEFIINFLYKTDCFLEMLLRLSKQPIFYRKNPLKAINRIIPRIIGSKNLVYLLEKNAQRFNYEKSDYVIRMRRSTNGFTGALKKDFFQKHYLPFEGIEFCVPKEYDQWLKAFYGDYMKLPEESKRIPSHICECYTINEDEKKSS